VPGSYRLRLRLAERAEAYLRGFYAWDTRRRWENGEPPEWFDHRADLFRWSELRSSFWVERGVYSRAVMTPGCRVLDLCSGDGFYAFHFFSPVASHVDALDRDPTAIEHAKRYHAAPNISYLQRDVVEGDWPEDRYDVVVWDGAIEHFPDQRISRVLERASAALGEEGILTGYTIVAKERSSHPAHQHEFTSAGELEEMLRPSFANVRTWETVYPDRHNLYFRASASPLPP
jgi:2-polyprenyl-3-methyl-5-hydroxy-6-metoxy-1,4-benzoquinol methylase